MGVHFPINKMKLVALMKNAPICDFVDIFYHSSFWLAIESTALKLSINLVSNACLDFGNKTMP